MPAQQDWARGLDLTPVGESQVPSDGWASGLDLQPVEETPAQSWFAKNSPVSNPVTRAIGAGLNREGNVLKGVFQDIAEVPSRLAYPEQFDWSQSFRNTRAAALDEETPSTVEAEGDRGFLAGTKRVAESAIHMAPAMLLSSGLGAAGAAAGVAPLLSHSLAAGTVFGFGKEGFDPKQAVAMGLAPVVGSIGSKAILGLATKMGVQLGSETALNTLSTIGSGAATQAYFDLLALPDYLAASPEKRAQMWAEQAGLHLALRLPGLVGLGAGALGERQASKAFEKSLTSLADLKARAEAVKVVVPQARVPLGAETRNVFEFQPPPDDGTPTTPTTPETYADPVVSSVEEIRVGPETAPSGGEVPGRVTSGLKGAPRESGQAIGSLKGKPAEVARVEATDAPPAATSDAVAQAEIAPNVPRGTTEPVRAENAQTPTGNESLPVQAMPVVAKNATTEADRFSKGMDVVEQYLGSGISEDVARDMPEVVRGIGDAVSQLERTQELKSTGASDMEAQEISGFERYDRKVAESLDKLRKMSPAELGMWAAENEIQGSSFVKFKRSLVKNGLLGWDAVDTVPYYGNIRNEPFPNDFLRKEASPILGADRDRFAKRLASKDVVSVSAVRDYGLNLPSGYVRDGDRYIYRSNETRASVPPPAAVEKAADVVPVEPAKPEAETPAKTSATMTPAEMRDQRSRYWSGIKKGILDMDGGGDLRLKQSDVNPKRFDVWLTEDGKRTMLNDPEGPLSRQDGQRMAVDYAIRQSIKAQIEAAPAKKPFKKGKARGNAALDTPGGMPGGRPSDILDTIKANTYIRSNQNIAEGTEGYYTPEQAEIEKRMPQLFSRTGETPDAVLGDLRRNGNMPENSTVSDLWKEMWDAQEQRLEWFKSKKSDNAEMDVMMKQQDRFVAAKERFSEDPSKADEVFPEVLTIGTTFQIAGEKFTVTEVGTYETGSPKLVTVSDGNKFGDQQLKSGDAFYPDKGTIKFPKPPTEAVKPVEPPAPEAAKPSLPPKATAEERAAAIRAIRSIENRQSQGDIRPGDSAEIGRLQEILGQGDLFGTQASDIPLLKPPVPPSIQALNVEGKVKAWTEFNADGSTTSYVTPDTPKAEHAALTMHEIVNHGGLEAVALKGGPEGQAIIDALNGVKPRLESIADDIARKGGFADAAALRKTYWDHYVRDAKEKGIDTTTPEFAAQFEQTFLFELLGRKAEEYADGRLESPTWWQTFLGKIKDWIDKTFGTRLSDSGIEALLRIGVQNMRGKSLEVRAIPDANGELRYSLKPASDEAEYRKQTLFDPKMPAAEQDRLRTTKFISNEVAVGPVERDFTALPSEVKAQLPELSGRLNAKGAATRDLKGTVPARQSLRDMATASSPRIEDQTAVMFEGTNNIFELVDSVNDLQSKVETSTKEFKALEKAEAARDQAYPVASSILTDARKRLTAQRASAERAGNAALVDSINRSIGDLQNRENAVAQVLTLVAKGIPATTLTNPVTTPFDIANWMITRAAGKFSTETGALVSKSPDIVQQLRVVAGLEPSETVRAAQANLKAQTDALAFMRDKVLANPEFRNNYEQAVEWSGSAGIREEIGGNPHYKNPYNPEDTRTIYPDFDQATWEKNQSAFNDVRQWLERYIQDPKADPLKREGYKFALKHLELLQSQSFAPERGKVSPSAVWNPSYLLIRAIPKFFDVPEHILELIGGRIAYTTYYDLANLSVANERMMAQHEATKYAPQKATIAAAKAAGFKGTDNQLVNRWQQDIGNDIFSSYQTRGEHRLKAGDMVNGHKITKADMDAVQAQKDYIDGILGVLKAMRKGPAATTQGVFSPIRTLDVIGKTAYEREAQDTSGLTVPQKLKPITRPFVDAWMLPEATDATRQALVHDPTYWNPVLSHVESFSNPDYRSFIDSPFAREYIDIAHDIANTGKRPANLDELADDLFVRLGNNIDLRTMSVDEIKAQFMSEINHVVRASEMERASHPVLVKDAPSISAISAENFMNRPRGQRLLPKGFYDYTIATEEQMSSVRTSAKEIYTHRLLKSATQMLNALTAKRAAFHERVQQGLAKASDSRKAVYDGTELVHLKEIDRLIPQLNRFISDFKQSVERAREDERDVYSMVNVARGWLSNSLLQRFGTLWRNAGGGVMSSALMDREMLAQGHKVFYRNWLTNPLIASAQGAKRQGQSFITLATGLLGGTERGKSISKALATNSTVLGRWGGDIAQFIDRQTARVEEMERLQIISKQNVAERIATNFDLLSQRGRITKDLETPNPAQKVGRMAVGAMEIAQELGLPLLQLPRSMGSSLVDNAVNATSRMQVQDMLDTLHMNSVGSLNTRMQFGPLDPKTAVLTPQEIFGLTGKSTAEMQRALTALRQEFAKAGVSLDRYLVEYHQAVQRAPGTNPQVLTPEQMNSLQYEMATRMNKGAIKNRPVWNNNATKVAMTFMGYGINQNARISQFLGSWSRDARKIDPSSFARAAYIVAAIAVLGPLLTYLPTKLIEKLLYNEDKPVKDLWETNSAGELALTALRQSYGVLPIVGQVLNYTLGSLTGAGSQGQFSLLPISMATAVANLVNKGIRTGEWERPVMELIRQWMPNSRIVINRLAMREGMTNEAAMRAALAANAPQGVEVRTVPAGGGIRQYSVISGQVDNIVNALSRSDGPDMATATSERADAIGRLVERGATAEDAAKTVDRAVLARDPYKSAYGRDLTEREKTELRSSLTAEQSTVMDTVEKGRQSYASSFGMTSPAFVKAERGQPAGESGGRGGGGRLGVRTGGSLRLGSGSRGGTAGLRAPSTAGVRSRGLRRGTVVGLRSPRRAKSPRFPRSRRLGSRRLRSSRLRTA